MTDKRPRLSPKTVPQSELTSAQRDEMWAVFERYYEDVARSTFEADLDRKDHVILLSDVTDGAIRGFSTLRILEREQGGEPYIAIFSGDTVIDSRYWGQVALQGAFYQYVIATRHRYPELPCYWFLISKGYLTYLLLAKNFPNFWPSRHQSTPNNIEQIVDMLSLELFGKAWRPERGVLKFEQASGRLRQSVVPVDERAMQDPDVRFFLERNPGHAMGDELCCIGAVDAAFERSYGEKLQQRRAQLRPQG